MNQTISRDILTVTHGVIVQQVNCQGVMGAGLAKQIADKWPRVKEEYLEICNRAVKPPLGFYKLTRINEGLSVASVFGQDGYERKGCHTNYMALIGGLKHLHAYTKNLKGETIYSMYIPHGIGCGLAGGDWHVVSALIEQELPVN
ncbi:MAG: Appr-1-p processing protein [Cyanobacteria bacterium P01_F01_bin.13]